ncbi:MAG: asparagine synthase (glutamine-hydrolyzing) [Deltaproteobacteria bacterium]|nr:asparagine synthase (glutamine-hydrolyzing) [Deltaproteobacteria bacterium]
MCSIAGCFNPKISFNEYQELNKRLAHRGPDNASVREYDFKDKKLFLGHNRLSIQDLSTNANQPMENKRFSIIFNGEIYNHLEIRKNLSFKNWRTHSDTETILFAFEELGIENALSKINGMFAIALFDKVENRLYLIRDRIGIKPLYYTFQNKEFAFASELKGIPDHLRKETSDKALIQFMSIGYIPADNTFYKDLFKLKAGRYIVFDGDNITLKRYWKLSDKRLDISFDNAVKQTHNLLKSAVSYRLLADVEVGCFLSGGIDSSLVAAIMSRLSEKKIKTFSIGFEDKRYDESGYAKNVASLLKTDHYEYICRPADIIKLIDNFDYYFDEPFGDDSGIPTMLLSDLASKHVKATLSGDGGDELFLGYDRYFITDKLFNILKYFPKPLRSAASFIMAKSDKDKLEKLSYPVQRPSLANIYSVLASCVKPWNLKKIFTEEFISQTWQNKELDLFLLQETEPNIKNNEIISALSIMDFHLYLPDDILTKVDRATMKYSLEARVPILDHRIAEFAYALPLKIKLAKGRKSILREILYKYLPQKSFKRPKKGFGVPLKDWFKKELKDLLYDKLESLDNRFNKKYLYKMAAEHINNNKNYDYIFWCLLRLK